jgi:histidinol phosphatase-like PHP family hydrolase
MGVRVARKGWLRKEDVLNTMSAKDVEAFLEKPKGER